MFYLARIVPATPFLRHTPHRRPVAWLIEASPFASPAARVPWGPLMQERSFTRMLLTSETASAALLLIPGASWRRYEMWASESMIALRRRYVEDALNNNCLFGEDLRPFVPTFEASEKADEIIADRLREAVPDGGAFRQCKASGYKGIG